MEALAYPMSTAVALEALGYGCEDSGLVFSICAHLLACVVPIWRFGSEEQKRHYLSGLCDGSLIAANGMSEPESGSDAFALRTIAEPHGSGFRINGTKIFVSNAPIAEVAVIFASPIPRKAITAALPRSWCKPRRTAIGLARSLRRWGFGHRPSANSSSRTWSFRRRPCSAALAAAPDYSHTLWSGSAPASLRAMLAPWSGFSRSRWVYARTRRQSGHAISKYQAVSHKIADMKVKLEAARLLTYKAAWNLERSKSVSLDASIAKLFVSESLVGTALDVVQVFGGYGFLSEVEVERALRDAIGSKLYSGTSEVQRNIIAGWLGL
jgi:alkylation response protein AidB-like acyl-CoA dehydrogenase